MLRELGDHEAAAELLEEALDTARRHYGGDHPEVVKRLSNVGVTHLDEGRFARAEELFRQALDMGARLGQSPSELFRMKNNLAGTLTHQGRFAEAEELYLDVLRGRQELYAPDDLNLASSRRNLGALYYTWGEPEKAERHLREALAVRLSHYGGDDTRVAAVLDLLGSVAAEQGRRREAEELYGEALRIRRERYGEDHLRLAWTKKNLAALLLDEDPATARVLIAQALAVYARSRPQGWERAEAESVLGTVLLRLGRPREAEPCLHASWETLQRIRGESSIYAQRARRRLAGLFEARAAEREPRRSTGASGLHEPRRRRGFVEHEDESVGIGLDDLVVLGVGGRQSGQDQKPAEENPGDTVGGDFSRHESVSFPGQGPDIVLMAAAAKTRRRSIVLPSRWPPF